MYKKRIVQLKIFNTFFFNLFVFNIVFSLMIFTREPYFAVEFFLIGVIVVSVMALPNFLLAGIVITDAEMIIRKFGVKGFKRYCFKYSNIQEFEVKRVKMSVGFIKYYSYYIGLHYLEGDEKKTFIIDGEKYFFRQFKELFEYLNKTHNITFDNDTTNN